MKSVQNTKFKNRDGEIIKEFTGRSWMGTYHGGELGFCSSVFLGHEPQNMSQEQRVMLSGKGSWFPTDLYRVEVTVRLVTNNEGHPIIRKCTPPNKSTN